MLSQEMIFCSLTIKNMFMSFLFLLLQEIETDQFYSHFLPELQALGYDGVFSPKSRAKTMLQQERGSVDGCAIFYRQSK